MQCGFRMGFRITSAVVCARSRSGARQEWVRIAQGVGQERTTSGPGAHQERARGAPGVGQERTKHEMWFPHRFPNGFCSSMH